MYLLKWYLEKKLSINTEDCWTIKEKNIYEIFNLEKLQ